MNAKLKAGLLALVALLGLGALTACGEIAPPDQVGLWYTDGPSEDHKFDHCLIPGSRDEWSWNDTVYLLPNNLRTWNLAPSNGDSNQPLVVLAKPDANQQTGLEVNVWVQVNFMLNTWCGDNEKDANSPLVQWWQKLGDRYDADTDAGWVRMLANTVVPALEKAKNVLRVYTADQLVAGTVWAEAEGSFGTTFSDELERLAGGDFFCGPDFVRSSSNCSPVQVSIKDVDLRDPAVQAARNQKQVASEQAQAAVIEAEGKVAAAKALQQLYGNAAWMQLQVAQVELEKAKVMAEACKAAGARCIIGTAGNVLIQQ